MTVTHVSTPPPVRGELRYAEPLARHTSWRVGGAAERFFIPADLADLIAFLRVLPTDEPLFWLGLGSNLLVRDGGIPGTVIAVSGALKHIEPLGKRRWHVECGVSCAKFARLSTQAGDGGMAFFAGIPGTVGGALAMNAGAFGGETWPLVESVQTLDRYGVLRRRQAEDFAVGYRRVNGPAGEYFASAIFRLHAISETDKPRRIGDLLEKRKQSQPIGLPSCGSVFRNPLPHNGIKRYAAQLIESAGLKGLCQGGACVSEKHANFIINQGNATAADIEYLIKYIQENVEKIHGIQLETEVHIVGKVR